MYIVVMKVEIGSRVGWWERNRRYTGTVYSFTKAGWVRIVMDTHDGGKRIVTLAPGVQSRGSLSVLEEGK